MPMIISGESFEGPFAIDAAVIDPNRAAVYVIICTQPTGKHYVIDVGESGEVGDRPQNHPRLNCWLAQCKFALSVYLRYLPLSEGFTADDRRHLETKIRQQYSPPCGAR